MNKFSNVSVALLSTLAISPIFANVHTVKADNNVKYVKEKTYTLKKLTNRLAKAGYVYKLASFKSDDIKDINGKTLSSNILKNLRKANPDFKVNRITIYSGATASQHVDLISKNHHYQVQTDYLNGAYNKNVNLKALKPIVKMELNMINKNEKQNLDVDSFNQLRRLVDNVSDKHAKKIALQSYNELKIYAKNRKETIPTLLLGQGIY
ncbi:hypothetical protein M2S00_03900 [Apilactobacillus sp. TMW 2.2459]|uniref:hypothetical protein n=1 Tax=Apilactobacillus xinyiensis TaxID=2841032 RepID=UPI00200EB524|nr:hypothetical protein [Apilactobacillus xinyiensis]MCL0312243.1 hypothetical protein [Apilactobacillus xinyiensis]